MPKAEEDSRDKGDGARQATDFFESKLFKIVAAVLCALGIGIGIATGFNFSGRVPAINSQIHPKWNTEKKPVIAPKRTDALRPQARVPQTRP